jgi:hypothetical protein
MTMGVLLLIVFGLAFSTLADVAHDLYPAREILPVRFFALLMYATAVAIAVSAVNTTELDSKEKVSALVRKLDSEVAALTTILETKRRGIAPERNR